MTRSSRDEPAAGELDPVEPGHLLLEVAAGRQGRATASAGVPVVALTDLPSP